MADSFTLAHDDVGSGEPLVLLHAGVADRRMWADMRAALPAGRRVVAPDLRGFGASPLPDRETAYTDAGDVAALMDSLGLGPADVVGSSLGGRVALELATTRPDLVRSLVLLCPAHDDIEPSGQVEAFGEAEDRLLEEGDVEGAVRLNVETWLGPEATEATRDAVSTMQRRAFEVQLGDPDHPGPERVEVDLTRVTAPTFVVVGEKDMDHFVAVGEHVSRLVPGAQLVRLPWAGHLPSLERPAETAALVDRWAQGAKGL